MRIPAEASIATSEGLLKTLHDENTFSRQIEIPTFINHLTAGADSSLTQFLLSWAQKEEMPLLKTFAKNEHDQQISSLSQRLYGLIALLTSEKIVAKNSTDITLAARKEGISRLALLQKNNPMSATRGRTIEVVAADHLGRSHPLFLYCRDKNNQIKLRPRSHFIRMARYLIKQTMYSGKEVVLDTQLIRAVGILLYEAFRNTEDHALNDMQGNPLPISCRLFQASPIDSNHDNMVQITKEFPPLSDFFNRQIPKSGHAHVNCFSLSILDSGLGYAQTWTKKPLSSLSLEEELEATLTCFLKGMTSKGHDRFGEGLALILKTVKKHNGFLRLRTGRLSLYYDGSDEYEKNTLRQIFRTWSFDSGDEALAPASGTLLTLIIPLGKK